MFDDFVEAVNCSDVPSGQVLQCIRELSSTEMQSAVGSSAAAFWDVTVDGTFLVDMPQISLVKGNVSNVPVVTGMSGFTPNPLLWFSITEMASLQA